MQKKKGKSDAKSLFPLFLRDQRVNMVEAAPQPESVGFNNSRYMRWHANIALLLSILLLLLSMCRCSFIYLLNSLGNETKKNKKIFLSQHSWLCSSYWHFQHTLNRFGATWGILFLFLLCAVSSFLASFFCELLVITETRAFVWRANKWCVCYHAPREEKKTKNVIRNRNGGEEEIVSCQRVNREASSRMNRGDCREEEI